MNQFTSILSNSTYTENQMVTNRSSLNPHLDLFYRVGNRSKDATGEMNIPLLFRKAAVEDEQLAIRIMGWSRSIQNGAGVREHIRSVIEKEVKNEAVNWSWFGKNGYWKDIFYWSPNFYNSVDNVLLTVKQALAKEDNLILKYLPRMKKDKNHKNSKWARLIADALQLSPKDYRKMCASFKTPEYYMCANGWSMINYNEVPSVCMHRNRKNFTKHDPLRFEEHIKAVKEGKVDKDGKVAKINVKALYPHNIIQPLLDYRVTKETAVFAEVQWSQLENKFESNKKIFVIADNSGSMSGEPMAISKALAIYLSERLTGAFHNFFSIFSDKPVFMQFEDSDSLLVKLLKMSDDLYAYNTDLERVFSMVLHKATSESIPKEDMPELIMIISDMQFDQCTKNINMTALEMIKDQYKNAGYEMPALVFWNVRNSAGVPAKANDKGVILFSGASPNCIKQAIEGEIDPMSAMLKIVDKPEYDWML